MDPHRCGARKILQVPPRVVCREGTKILLLLCLFVSVGTKDQRDTPGRTICAPRRKLEFARTLATGAKTLLLDEIFAGLTTGEIAMITDLIKQLRRQGFTFLIVSHDLPAITPLVDRVIAIELGALLAEGTMSEVLANEAVRASYLGES